MSNRQEKKTRQYMRRESSFNIKCMISVSLVAIVVQISIAVSSSESQISKEQSSNDAMTKNDTIPLANAMFSKSRGSFKQQRQRQSRQYLVSSSSNQQQVPLAEPSSQMTSSSITSSAQATIPSSAYATVSGDGISMGGAGTGHLPLATSGGYPIYHSQSLASAGLPLNSIGSAQSVSQLLEHLAALGYSASSLPDPGGLGLGQSLARTFNSLGGTGAPWYSSPATYLNQLPGHSHSHQQSQLAHSSTQLLPLSAWLSSAPSASSLLPPLGVSVGELMCAALVVAVGGVVLGAPFVLLYMFLMNYSASSMNSNGGGGSAPGGLGGGGGGGGASGTIALTGPSSSSSSGNGRKKRAARSTATLLANELEAIFNLLVSSLAKYR